MNRKPNRAPVSRVLLSVSVFLVLGGIVVIDPMGGLLFLALGGILTSVAAFLSSERTRLLALLLLAVAIFFSVLLFPEAQRSYEIVRDRARTQSTNDRY